MKKTYAMDMTSGSLMGKLIRFTIPVLITNILQLLYNAADLIVVGQFSAVSAAVGAVGATNALVGLMTNLFIGMGIGVNVVAGHAIGKGLKNDLPKIIGTATLLSLLSGVAVGVIGVVFSGTFLSWMGTPDGVIDLSAKYLRIYFLGMPAQLLFNFLAAILRADGDTRRPLFFLTVSGILNVILNVVFVLGFSMDVDGVAYATIIAQYLSAVLVFLTLCRSTTYCRFDKKYLKFDRYYLGKILKIGLPSGAYSCMFSISNVIIQSAANSFNDAIIVKGLAASASIEGFVYTAMNAVSVATTSFVSQNTGAKQFKRVKRTVWESFVLVMAAWAVMTGIFLIFKDGLFRIYLPGDPVAIDYGMTRALILILPYFLCGFMDVASGALRGLGKSLLATCISLTGACVLRLVWIYTVFYPTKPTMAVNDSLFILYISYPISWTITLLALMIAFFAVVKRNVRHYGNTLPVQE